MTINDIINKHYNEFYALCKNKDIAVAFSKTSEDVLHDIIFRAMNKFKNKEIDYDFGYNYLRRNIINQLRFQNNKIKEDPLVYTDNLTAYDCSIEVD